MTAADEYTLAFKAVVGVTVADAGDTVVIEFQGSSDQTISVRLPVDASHDLSRKLMRAQIEAAAQRGMRRLEGNGSAVPSSIAADKDDSSLGTSC